VSYEFVAHHLKRPSIGTASARSRLPLSARGELDPTPGIREQPGSEALNKTLHEVLADPDRKKRLLELGVDSRANTPAEMDAQPRADTKKWAR